MRFAATIPMFALCLAAGCVLRTPSLDVRTSLPIGVGPGPGAGPGPAPEAAAPDGEQIIEAGCTFNGSQIKGEPGSLHQVVCPAGCDKNATLYGTENYTSDSPVCAAAMHVGAISDRGGAVTVMVEAGRPAYRGSKRNGVTSHDWGAYHSGYRFEGVVAAPVAAPVVAPVVVEAGCSLRGDHIHGEPGSKHRVSCPAGCNVGDPQIWGSDPFNGDSQICAAAIHAGLATERGGEFTLILDEGRPAYRGSKRNGITSRDWGAYRGSYRFEGVVAAPVAAPVVVEAGCSLRGNDIQGEPGSKHRVACPAGCNAGEPQIWGSDPFNGDSQICAAAIHAGLASDRGGEFTLILDEGRPAYRGSKRNGMQSADLGAYRTSFRLQR